MPKDFYKDIVGELKSCGYAYLRQAKGSHEMWWNPITEEKVVVPKSKSRHTANAIMKSAGSTKRF